jgi:hypothetical protein
MTDPERDHLVVRIAALERRLRRWRLACLVLLTLLLLPVVLGGLLGVAWVPRLERERDRLEAERQRAERAEMEALSQRDGAEHLRQEAERERALAEEEAGRVKALRGPGEAKD